MSRTNKKSRIKGLPPRIQLQKLDCENVIPNSVWNDNDTVNFLSESVVNAGFYLHTGSIWYNENSEETVTTMYVTSSVLKTNADNKGIINFETNDVIFPFRDSDNPAADGKSQNSEFYATGSAIEQVGEGFNQPLWSKLKIEVDISSADMEPVVMAISQSNLRNFNNGLLPVFQQDLETELSYPMMYYNFDLKKWEPIGYGTVVGNDRYQNSVRNMFYSGTIGFTPGLGFNANQYSFAINTQMGGNAGKGPAYSGSWNQSTSESLSLLTAASASIQCTNLEYFDKMGRLTDNYTFPYGPQFHATSSQTLKMKNYISKPFLAEKIVLEISGATYTVFDTINNNGFAPEEGIIYPFAKNSVFLLNQRRNRNFDYVPNKILEYPGNGYNPIYRNVSIPTNKKLTVSGSEEYVNTNRDIITYGSVTSFTNDFTGSYNRYILPLFQTVPVATDVTASMFYLRFPEFTSQTVTANTQVITQSYFIRDFIEEDVVIDTSKSLAVDRMSALGFQNEKFKMELEVKTPNVYPNGGLIDPIIGTDTNGFIETCDIELGGRNMLGLTNVSGRDVLNSYGTTLVNSAYYGNPAQLFDFASYVELFRGEIDAFTLNLSFPYGVSDVISLGGFYSLSPMFSDNSTEKLKLNYTKTNPYLLLPEDELVLGWQQPIPNILELNTYLSMSISGTYSAIAPYDFQYGSHHVTGVLPHTNTPATNGEGIVHISSIQINGDARLIIYGSEVSNNKEQNDSTNQILSSNALQRVIG